MNETSRALCAQYVIDGQWADVERLLGHVDWEIRQAAAAVCCGFASQKSLDLAPVVSALEARLGDENEVAKEAAYALAFQYLQTKQPQGLVSLLALERPLVRQTTGLALSNAVQAGHQLPSDAQDALWKLLDDPDRGTVHSATRALLFQRAMKRDRAGVDVLTAHARAGVAAQSVIAGGLCDVAAEDNAEGVRLWLALGASANARNSDGQTALALAAKAGARDAVASLLAGSAKLDEVDTAGRTALMFAAYQGHLEVVRMLLAKGADANLVSGADFTALDYAAKGNEVEVANLLHERGAKMGDVGSVMSFACSEGNLAICRIVIKHSPPLNALDGNGLTGLMYAAMKGNEDLVKLLLEHGAARGIANAEGKTALAFAKMNDHEAVMRLLESAPG